MLDAAGFSHIAPFFHGSALYSIETLFFPFTSFLRLYNACVCSRPIGAFAISAGVLAQSRSFTLIPVVSNPRTMFSSDVLTRRDATNRSGL